MSLIEERIIKVIMEQLNMPREECVPEADFIDDLGAGCLDRVELAMAIEENFGVTIADDEIERVCTIQNLVDLVIDRLDRKRRGEL